MHLNYTIESANRATFSGYPVFLFGAVNATAPLFYHNFSGSLVGEYRQTDGGDLSYFLSYDSDGNKVEKTSINGQTKTITTGTDEDGKSYVSNDGVTAKTITDDFNRKTEVKTSRGESVNI